MPGSLTDSVIRKEFRGIIRLNFAGAPFPQNDMHKVHSFFPNAKIFNNYGCAEAMPRLTIRSEEISEDGSNIGKVLPGVEMKTDEEGKILFKSPYSAVGFYDNGKFMSLTEDMWISSGDFGSELEKGYWSVKGRTNEVFKRFGEKISIPQLLKSVFSKWGGSAVFYSESDSGGERGHVLVVSPRPNEKQLRDVLSVFRSGYSRAHWPIRLESVDSFPLLENGKVDRVSLMDSNDRVTHWYQRI